MNVNGNDITIEIGTSAQKATNQINELVNAIKRLSAESGHVKNPLSEFKGKTKIKIDSSDADKATKKMAGLQKVFSSFKRIAFYRAIRSAIRFVTDGFKEGLQNAYQFSKGVGGPLASALDNLSSAGFKMKNQLGAAFGQLIVAITPILLKLIDIVTAAANAVTQFFALLSGQSTYKKATNYWKEWGDAAGGAGKSAKEARKYLAPFDELNVLPSASSSGGGGGTSPTDYENMFEVTELDNWAKKLQPTISWIKDNFDSILQVAKAIGLAILAWKVSRAFSATIASLLGLKKTGLVVGLTLLITGIALEGTGIAGAIEDGLGGVNFAEILGGGTAITIGGAKLGGLLGSSVLGAAIGSIVAGLPAFFLGIYDAAVNGINWLNGVLIPVAGTAAGAGIGALIGSIGGPLGALIGAAVGLVSDGVILIVQNWDTVRDALSTFFTETIPGIWNDFVTWITKTVPEWFASLPEKISQWFSDLWQPIKDFDWKQLGYDIGHWLGTAVKDAITFVTETIPNWLKDVWETIKSEFKKFITETLPYFFNEWLPQAWEDVKNFFEELPQKIWDAVQVGWQWLVDTGSAIIDGLVEGWQTVWTAITDFVDGFVQGFKDALGIHSPSRVFEDIGDNIIQGLWNGIKEKWEGVKKWFTEKWNSLKTWWKNLSLGEFKIKTPHISWTSTPASGWIANVLSTLGLPTSLPKLNVSWYARGGIVDRATLIGAGEAGKEAIVPLERNTQWVGMVAGQLANQLGNQNSGGYNADLADDLEDANGVVVNAIFAATAEIVRAMSRNSGNGQNNSIDIDAVARQVTRWQNNRARAAGI